MPGIINLKPNTTGGGSSVISYPGVDTTGVLDSRGDADTGMHKLLTLNGGTEIQLPAGTIRIGGAAAAGLFPNNGALFIPDDTTLIGHPDGTTFFCSTPVCAAGVYQQYFYLGNRVKLKNVTVKFDPNCDISAHNLGGTAAGLFVAVEKDGIEFYDVTILGGGEIQNDLLRSQSNMQFFGCNDLLLSGVKSKWARNTRYGIEIIGGENIRIIDSEFSYNGADGIKFFADNTYDHPNLLQIFDTTCNHNGMGAQQLSDLNVLSYTTKITAAPTTITPINGGRYQIALSAPGTITLPLGTAAGKKIFLARATNQVLTITVASGTLTGLTASSNSIVLRNSTFSQLDPDQTICFTESAGTWVATTLTNGEGIDGCGNNVNISRVVAQHNQATGIQIKPAPGLACSASNVIVSDCLCQFNRQNGFSIVNAGEGTVPPTTSIGFSECNANKNLGNGYILGTGPVHSASLSNCYASSNGSGIQIQQWCRNVTITGCHFRGNDNGLGGTTTYNAQITAASNVRFVNCVFSGVDAIDQDLVTEAQVDDPSNSKCYGMLIQKTQDTYSLANLLLDNCAFHNHIDGEDRTYWSTTGVPIFEKDFSGDELSTVFDRTTVLVRSPGDNKGTNLIIGLADGNILTGGGQNGNNGIISGAEISAPNQILGTSTVRWIVGGYDTTIDQTVASFCFGSSHGVIEASWAGHSMIAGGSDGTVLRNGSGSLFGCQSAVIGKTGTALFSSANSAVVATNSVIIDGTRCSISAYPDVVTSGQSGTITVLDNWSTPTPEVGDTFTANGTAYTQSATITFQTSGGDLRCNWTAHKLLPNDIVFFTGAGLPANVIANQNYYVHSLVDANAFILADAQLDVEKNWLSNGSGTLTGRKRNVVLVTYTLSSGVPVWDNVPFECYVDSVGGSTTTFSYRHATRQTHSFPTLTPNTTRVAVPQGLSLDKYSGGGNSITCGIDSHIQRGEFIVMHGTNVCRSKHSPIVNTDNEGQVPAFCEVSGQNCEVNDIYQAAKGWWAKPVNPTQRVVSAGAIYKAGDFQKTESFFMFQQTSSATPATMWTQSAVYGNNNWTVPSPNWFRYIRMPANTIWLMEGMLIANKLNSVGDIATWNWTATLTSGADAGNTAGGNPSGFGLITVRTFSSTLSSGIGTLATATWTIPTGVWQFEPTVTGIAATTINWKLWGSMLESTMG